MQINSQNTFTCQKYRECYCFIFSPFSHFLSFTLIFSIFLACFFYTCCDIFLPLLARCSPLFPPLSSFFSSLSCSISVLLFCLFFFILLTFNITLLKFFLSRHLSLIFNGKILRHNPSPLSPASLYFPTPSLQKSLLFSCHLFFFFIPQRFISHSFISL